MTGRRVWWRPNGERAWHAFAWETIARGLRDGDAAACGAKAGNNASDCTRWSYTEPPPDRKGRSLACIDCLEAMAQPAGEGGGGLVVSAAASSPERAHE